VRCGGGGVVGVVGVGAMFFCRCSQCLWGEVTLGFWWWRLLNKRVG